MQRPLFGFDADVAGQWRIWCTCLVIDVDKNTREFIAKNIADLGKAILTVGFASYFFKDLPIILRFGFTGLSFILAVS